MTRKPQMLAVDDSPDTLEVIERHLTAAGYAVSTAPGVAEALRALETLRVDVLITDQRMPRTDGMELVRHVRANFRDTAILMLTGYASIPNAVEAIQAGADAYLAKPFTEEELLKAIDDVLQRLQLRRPAQPDDASRAAPGEWGLLGDSPAMQTVFRAIEKAAQSDASILVSGESGTGKELVARAIHYQSPRRADPFVPVNCGGIPDGLLESELFGHRKGAFTGATENRAGFFQTAEGGTIFLDEIAELALPMQAVLLRVLQDKTVFMVGAREPKTVDVRVIAATNRNLEDLVERELFRRDLYYRIHVIPIELPPLRDRGSDLLLLIRHFAERFARELRKPTPAFTERTLSMLRAYPWPGNVRELENIIQRLVLMADRDLIDAPDLPAFLRFTADAPPALNRTLAEAEADYIRAVLASVDGCKTRAAKILGIDRKTLRKKLQPPSAARGA